LFGVSNGLTAVAMAGVVAKGISLIDIPLIAGSSLQAYFLGISLSVLLLLTLPHRAWFFTLFSSACLLAVAQLIPNPVVPITGVKGVAVFFLLAIGFGGWFAGRSLRVRAVALHEMIPWIDVPYHVAAVSAILLIPRMPIPFRTLLLIDCAILLLASALDSMASRVLHRTVSPAQPTEIRRRDLAGNAMMLAIAVVMITASVQGGTVSFVHHIPHFAPGSRATFATDVLAASYVGAALGAFACALLRTQIRRGRIKYVATRCAPTLLPAFVPVILAASFLAAAIAAAIFGQVFVAIAMTVFAIVSFQLVVIPLLHDIAALTSKTPFVQYCYCAMGLGVFVAMAALQLTRSPFEISACVTIAAISSLVALRFG